MSPGAAHDRWVQRHERLFLTLFLGVVVAVLTVMTVSAAGDGHALALAGAWIAGFGIAALLMYHRHRSGRLILRRAEDREVQREKNRASVPIGWALAGALVVVTAVGGLTADLAVAVVAGVLTAFAPVVLWIAYVLRPDQRPGEDL
jgi:hypothetical protein